MAIPALRHLQVPVPGLAELCRAFSQAHRQWLGRSSQCWFQSEFLDSARPDNSMSENLPLVDLLDNRTTTIGRDKDWRKYLENELEIPAEEPCLKERSCLDSRSTFSGEALTFCPDWWRNHPEVLVDRILLSEFPGRKRSRGVIGTLELLGTKQRRPWYEGRWYSSEGSGVVNSQLVKAMEKKMLAVEERYASLCQTLIDEPLMDSTRMAATNREISTLEGPFAAIRALRAKSQEVQDLQALMRDPKEDVELRQMAQGELAAAQEEAAAMQTAVLRELLPRDEANQRGCIIEVRAGTGGEEASLFAMDIFRMYERYAQANGWGFDVLSIAQSDLRGYKEASASIAGGGAFGRLKFESGVHRVQRVPLTEKSGRVHTSAASVAVLPLAEEVDVQVRADDLRIDTYRSGGAGGQSVNTTSSAVRITHLPTGIAVAIQDERSQHQNKAKAMKLLRAKLYDIERSRLASSRSTLRQEQIGSGDRSERIRTYNFPQARVTDHRINVTLHSLELVLQGHGLDTFVDSLQAKEEADAMAALGASSP